MAGGVAVAVASEVPQKPQSRNFEGFSSPQFEQKTVSGTGASAVPQNPHSLNRAGFSSPHDGQATVSTSGVYGRRPPKRVAPRRMQFWNDTGEVACPCSADPSRERLSAVAGCSATPTSPPSTPSPPRSASGGFARPRRSSTRATRATALFIVASGSVKVVLPSRRGRRAGDRRGSGAGEFFGELAILDGAPHSATIVAIEPTETLVLHRDAFLALIDNEPELRRALLASLATEIRRLTGHVEDLHFLDLPGRLASRILRLSVECEPDPDGAIRIAWPYTQSELAGMIGGSRQSVNRLLADLAEEGLVRIEHDVLVVTDRERLARTVER